MTETVPWDLGDAFFLGVGVLWGGDWSMIAQRVPVAAVSSGYTVRPFDDGTWVRLLRFERDDKRLRWTSETIPPIPQQMD